jgi:tetratricopeptide (TPR) repeat protein
MKRLFLSLAILFVAPLAWAECPAPPDIADRQASLFAELQEAENELGARDSTRALWELWTTAPDAAAQELLNQGMAARQVFDFLRAIERFDRLVDYCPDYAEGYNQRAFVNFLREDFDAALVDLDLALERSPQHVGALSGKALTLMGLGRTEEAQEVLREALALNPWIPERGLLRDMPGEDI